MRVYRRADSTRWWVDVHLATGRRLRLAGFSDKSATQHLGGKIERLSAVMAAGEELPLELVRWLERLPDRLTLALARHGLVDDRRMSALRPLEHHVAEWVQWTAARASQKHAQQVGRLVRRLLSELGWRHWGDLSAVPLQTYLVELCGPPRSISARTSNSYLGALRQFCRWMVSQGRAQSDPTASVSKINEQRAGRRKVRRALDEDEVAALLRATLEGPVRGRLDGRRRALVYRLALEAGLRAKEIRELQVRDLELDAPHGPTLVVRAESSKAGREDRLPLRADLVADLRREVAGKLPMARVFGGIGHPSRQSTVLRADLAAAGIPYLNEVGQSVDFHALRHTAISRWARAGVSPKTLQRLARHTTVKLTMDVYTHVSVADERAGVEAAPAIRIEEQEVARAAIGDRATQRATSLAPHGTGTNSGGSAAIGASRRAEARSHPGRLQKAGGCAPREVEAAPGIEPGVTDLQSVRAGGASADDAKAYVQLVTALCRLTCHTREQEDELRGLIEAARYRFANGIGGGE